MGISNQKSTPLSAVKILREGIKLPANNCNLLHPILILSFVSSCLFFLFNYFSITPLLTNINASFLGFAVKAETGSPNSSALLASMAKKLEIFYIVGFLSLIASFVVNSLLAIATIHVLSTAYSSKIPFTLKDVMSTLNRSLIKRSMITQLYVAFFQVGLLLPLMLLVGVLAFFYTYSEQKIVIIAFGVIVAIVAFHLYLYLAMVWRMSLVVSVANEGCYGLEGITKAGKLLGGRRRQAILIVFMELFAVGLVYVVYRFATGYAPPNKMAGLAVGVGQLVLGVVGNLFVWSVHTVYYYECNKIDAEEIAMNGSFMYVPVTTVVDAAYP